ncbi:MAG: hypothetical protein QM820_27970 [Minicystis sp.]
MQSAEDPRQALLIAANLLHEQGFDPVPLGPPGGRSLAHEVRWSESCPECGVIWIGSKSGEVLRIDLGERGIEEQIHTFGTSVRTLLHVHASTAFGGEGRLFVGTDDGYLHVLRRGADSKPVPAQKLHVETWWDCHEGRDVGAADDIERGEAGYYTDGVTALALLSPDAEAEVARIVVATRSGALFLLLASGRSLALRRLRAAADDGPEISGWIQWVVKVEGDTHVTCVSRGGELTRVSIDEPERGVETVGLSLLPTAAMPWSEGILLGTSEGLVYWKRDRRPQALSVAVTRAAVLSLDRLQIPLDDPAGGSRDFIIMGLDNGRLRVLNEEALKDLVERHTTQPNSRSYSNRSRLCDPRGRGAEAPRA